MTPLKRRVRRVVPGPRRALVVELQPAGNVDEGGTSWATITVREKGRRRGFTIGVGSLYVILASRAAEAARRNRRPRRGSKL